MCTEPELRVFVSYSHDNPVLFNKLKAFLEKAGFYILSDCDIGVGQPFTDAIKGLITHAHVFMPLVSAAAQKRPWVHQETGYAMARGIPILPLVTRDAGVPQDMVAQLQAIQVANDLSDLKDKLTARHIRGLVLPQAPPPLDIIRIADWPEQRSAMLAEYANRVLQLGRHAMLRQIGALSSFCLPDRDIADSVWCERDGDNVRGDYLHSCQRDERQALERHARQAGCRLILYPHLDFSDRGPRVRVTRLQVVLDFLETISPDKCQAVISRWALGGNRTILGDWFVAESMVPRAKGYRQTIFNWHAPTALRAKQEFDRTFEEACRAMARKPAEVTPETIAVIRQIIGEDERELAEGS